MKKYFPILVSKAGELNALANLSNVVKSEITPVLQILPESINKVEGHLSSHWAFERNEVFIDCSLIEDFSGSQKDLENFFYNMNNLGVVIVPVVHFDSDPLWISMVKDISKKYNWNVCIRTSINSGGFIGYSKNVNIILTNLEVQPNNVYLLMDLSFIDSTNHVTNATVAILAIKDILLLSTNWKGIIVSSGSFPATLDGMIPHNTYTLQRLEKLTFELIKNELDIIVEVAYSDYGTKNPIHSEVSFIGSSSIKYTTVDHYVIYRGEIPKNHPKGMGQYIDKASDLTKSGYYSGPTFSWGDMRIDQIVTDNNKPGNPQTWVEISQNHHITLLHSIL